MQVKSTLAAFIFSLTISALSAQVSKDATVPVTATVSTNPASITLNWPNPTASSLLIQRRTKGQGGNQWTQLLNVTNSTQTTLTDNNVALGQTYEYYVKRTSNVVAHGYAHVALEAPVTDSRGKLILLLDADIVAPLAPELERLRYDLVGDGWQIIEHIVDASATAQSVKSQIVADYNAAPASVKSVFLLGKIPVPYSGDAAWDGHSLDHSGAWPCDAYYAELTGTWTDVLVNNTSPTRDANDNIPGDGKFDQSATPTAVELQVGRVDFRRLSEGTFGATTVELLRRYLDKNHNWRTGVYKVENKALVDDNFFYFNGEAFAASGFRNAYPLVGEANVVEADFFANSNPQSYLMGYGCGSGGYSSAGGVGNSADFAVDTVNIVFSNLFGSYHGDWDYESNPFMPSALASRGGILTCGWAGRPHHFYQALASGETIGYCMKETQNANSNSGFFASISGEGGAHTALLGDPTLRAHIVVPPTNVTATADCGRVLLEWTASTDNSVVGYHIYQSASKHGAYVRLNINPVTGTSFSDVAPWEDTLYYQVRAVKLQTSPGGGAYWNTSTGAMTSVVYTAPPQISIGSTGGILTCINEQVVLNAISDSANVSYLWSGPNNFSSTNQIVIVGTAGIYNVTVTFADGCSAQATTTVEQDIEPPVAVIEPYGQLTCDNPCVTIYFNQLSSTTDSLVVCSPGNYAYTITGQNGCSTTLTFVVTEMPSQVFISYVVTDESAPGANDGGIDLIISGGQPITYLWSTGATTEDLLNIPGGTYTVTVTDAGGCVAVATFEVQTTTSGADESAVFQQLLLSPNPTDGPALLSIKLHKTADIQITVHDATGRLVLEKPEMTASELALSVDLREKPTGIYTVFIFVEKQVFARKLAVVR